MLLGVLLVLAACLIWGLIFVVPLFMAGFTAFEVVLGRHLCFGTLSICLLFYIWGRGALHISREMIFKALLFALVTNIIYYTTLVLALRSASPAVTALISGLSPITIALYGNLKQRTYSFKSLLVPSILILLGLILVNIPALENRWFSDNIENYLFGLVCALAALIAWTWYVVANAEFLKRNPGLPASQWATMIGAATFCWVALLGITVGIVDATIIDIAKIDPFEERFIIFLTGCLILGIVCSWIGSYLWHRASTLLPIALAGQLTVFETVFALMFVFFVEARIPFASEVLGILIMLAAVVGSLWMLEKRKKPIKEIAKH
ncbi:MAG: EamA family transporter [Parachlamydia sp.]|nr:MAG: EamA family transporter [Parachlamydia sp.]